MIGRLVAFLVLSVLSAGVVRADTQKELQPRPVELNSEAMPLSEALAALTKQTGNQVADRRQNKTDPKIKLDLKNTSFWTALDAIAQAASCGISTYQSDGQVALIDQVTRPSPTIYAGIFRIVAGNVHVAQNFEAGTHVCIVTFDIAWEPRVEPLYLEVGPLEATFAADSKGVKQKAKAPSQGKISVAGRNAIGVNVPFPAPDRSVRTIEAIAGQLRLTSAGKTLTFSFPQLKADTKKDEAEGVQVTLAPVKTSSRRWSVEVTIDNPLGGPAYESYQSWLGNNRALLEKGEGPGRKTWLPEAGDERVELETATQAKIFYSFHLPAQNDKSQPSDWNLTYRTPGRIVEMSVPLSFKDIPLP